MRVETQLTGRGQRHGLGDASVRGARGERPEAGRLGTEENVAHVRREPFDHRCFSPPMARPILIQVQSDCQAVCVWTELRLPRRREPVSAFYNAQAAHG